MNSRLSMISAVSIIAFLIWQSNQEDAPTPPTDGDRLDQIESRVSQLEKILFMTSSLTVFEAERRLEDARQSLRGSKELLMQGHITQTQFQLEELQVRQLERELEFARSPAQPQQAISELELIAAERRLAEAEYQFNASKVMAGRGFGSDKIVQRDAEYVEIAKKNLEVARTKVEAAKKLEAIQNPKK